MPIDADARGLAAYANTSAGISAAGGALRTDLLIPTAWATATAYAANAAVTQGGVAYLAVITHTSGTFATDLAAGKWVVYQGVSQVNLADSATSTLGAGLVGYRKTTVLDAIDQRQPELRLHRLKSALATITETSSGTASIMMFGDSITRSLWPEAVTRQLYRAYGFRGVFCSLNNAINGPLYDVSNLTGGAASGTVSNNNHWTVAPNGASFSLSASGHRVTFGGLVNFHPLAYTNRATIVYVKKSGGGIFKVQTLRANGGEQYPQDVVGSTAVDTSDTTTSLATLQIDLPAREIGNKVSILWQSGGDVEIIGCLMEDTTAAGLIMSYMDAAGIDMNNTNTLISAGLSTLLTLVHPDLIYWSMKDGATSAVVTPKITAHQTLWDGAYTTNWLYSAPYPDTVSQTEAAARGQADPVIAHAIANGHDYWNPLPDCPTYAYATSRSWITDGTHFTSLACNTLSPRLWRATGLLPAFRAGTTNANLRAPAAAVDTLMVNNADYATTLRSLRESAILSGKRGIKFSASTDSYALSQAATTAPRTGSYTFVWFGRIPTGSPVNMELVSLRTSGFGGNQNGAATLSLETASIRLYQRSTAGTTVSWASSAAGAAAWAMSGQIVMIVARRDASLTDDPPINLFLEAARYIPSNQFSGDPLTDITATLVKVGDGTNIISTSDIECYGAAYYTSALGDATLALASLTGQLPSGYDTGWQFNAGFGAVVGNLAEKPGDLIGTYTWLAPTPNRTVRVVTAAGAVTVSAMDDIVVIAKTTGAATAANLPAGVKGMRRVIKDGKGDAATNNITITPASGNIDGAATKVISANYGAAEIIYSGTQWLSI